MKMRNGFVSNSSSSSFVIAYKKNLNYCEHCKRSDKTPVEMVKDIKGDRDSDQTCIISESANEIINQMFNDSNKYNKGYPDSLKTDAARITVLAKSISEYLDNGFEIAYINMSYHEDSDWKETFFSNCDILLSEG